jgi:hypothetical protein
MLQQVRRAICLLPIPVSFRNLWLIIDDKLSTSNVDHAYRIVRMVQKSTHWLTFS